MAKGLGKQFGSLLPDNFDDDILLDKKDRIQHLQIEELSPNPHQPRREFDQTEIDLLASSLKRHGVLQPLIATPESDKYIIIAGERRWRAAKKAKLESLPVLVRSSEELDRLEIGLIENVQRVDLSPLEQAISIARLHEQFNISYEDIAKRLGKAHTSILNTIRLLVLTPEAQEALRAKKITEGHGKALAILKDNPENLNIILQKVIQQGLNVRQTESLVRQYNTEQKVKASKVVNDSYKPKLDKLSKIFGSKVAIANKSRGKGLVTIQFENKKQLESLLEVLSRFK